VGANDPGTNPEIDFLAQTMLPSTSDPVFRMLVNPSSVPMPFPPDVVGSRGAALSHAGNVDLPLGSSVLTSSTAATSSSATPYAPIAADSMPASHAPSSAPEVDS
jgi:hypothetical protein